MHPDIVEAHRREVKARIEYNEIVKRVQSECTHPKEECVISENTRETYTIGCGYGSSRSGAPPFIVCKECGYSECTWYGPHKIGHKGLTGVKYKEAISYCVGPTQTKEGT